MVVDPAALDALLVERARVAPHKVQHAVSWYHLQCQQRGLPALEPRGLPLRPFLLPQALVPRLEIALAGVAAALETVQAARGPCPEGFSPLEQRHRAAGHRLDLWRPDLRLERGAMGLLDLNVGTPTAVTIFETDLLREFYFKMFEALDLDAKALGLAHHAAVAPRVVTLLRARFPHVTTVLAVNDPSRLLDAHQYDGQLAGFLDGIQRGWGVDVVVASPQQAATAAVLGDPRTLVLQLNTEDLTLEPAWQRYLPLLSVSDVEHRWWTSPFSGALEKHLLPSLSQRPWPAPLCVPEAMAVTPEVLADLLQNQDAWVVKHGGNLKRVLVGRACQQSTWRDGVTLAAHLGGYVAQRLVQQVPSVVPVWEDGAVKLVEVEEEYSPFILEGKILTFFVRYLPLGSPSMVVSPPPKDLGLGVAWSWAG